MSDLDRMKKLAGIREWDDEWDDDEQEESGPQMLYLLEVVVRHEGSYFAGIYSSQELAHAAEGKLGLGRGESARVSPVALDADPETKYF